MRLAGDAGWRMAPKLLCCIVTPSGEVCSITKIPLGSRLSIGISTHG